MAVEVTASSLSRNTLATSRSTRGPEWWIWCVSSTKWQTDRSRASGSIAYAIRDEHIQLKEWIKGTSHSPRARKIQERYHRCYRVWLGANARRDFHLAVVRQVTTCARHREGILAMVVNPCVQRLVCCTFSLDDRNSPAHNARASRLLAWSASLHRTRSLCSLLMAWSLVSLLRWWQLRRHAPYATPFSGSRKRCESREGKCRASTHTSRAWEVWSSTSPYGKPFCPGRYWLAHARAVTADCDPKRIDQHGHKAYDRSG